MKKSFYFAVFGLIFLVTPNIVLADAIVTISSNGKTSWNVLGAESDREIKIKKIANLDSNLNGKISVYKEGNSFQVIQDSGNNKAKADITNFEGDVVEVESRGESKNLSIKVSDGKFILIQGENSASTEYPVEIDPGTALISVKAPTGLRFIVLLPQDAAELAINARLLDEIDPNSPMLLTENEFGELHYEVKGTRIIDLKITKIPVEVTANLSASTGRVLTVDSPIWFKVVGLLIT